MARASPRSACRKWRDSVTAFDIESRLAAIDWPGVVQALDTDGSARLPALLTREECAVVAGQYDHGNVFRTRVVMARHGFGRGEYQYYAYPIPEPIAALRALLYPRLVGLANRWHELLGIEQRFPQQHAEFLRRCHAAGQTRPTPLLLRYETGDYNCLHQDLYGENVFPLQVAILLSAPGRDFEGGEFVMTEQRPRMQSRAHVVGLRQGEAIAFAVSHRPVKGTRGTYRVNLRHGVSRVTSGRRHVLGIIFHDAQRSPSQAGGVPAGERSDEST